MRLEQLRPHLWRWTAPHPDWKPEHAEGGQGWEQEVACAAIVRDREFVLVDPLVPADDEDRFWRAVDRDVEHHGAPHVVLTVAWHGRSTPEIAARYPGTSVWAHGDPLPGGLVAFDARWAPEVVLWSAEHRALITGDVILGGASGGLRLLPDSWLPDNVTRTDVAEALTPLLELPVELVLPAHGEAVTDDARGALARALSA
jgi:glyoxylase-like metal-dependent hydrolase (beta-lactamase superfamily II)